MKIDIQVILLNNLGKTGFLLLITVWERRLLRIFEKNFKKTYIANSEDRYLGNIIE